MLVNEKTFQPKCFHQADQLSRRRGRVRRLCEEQLRPRLLHKRSGIIGADADPLQLTSKRPNKEER